MVRQLAIGLLILAGITELRAQPPAGAGSDAAATAVVTPAPGAVPMKPASSTPASATEPNSKSGTTIVKSAPPKETARITVKPNLPGSPVRAGSNFPVAKPAGAVPVAVAAGAAVGAAVVAKAVGSKPATTIVKTGTTKVTSPTVRSASGSSAGVSSTQFQEEGSTTLTTALALALALLTWGTAGVLLASYFALI